MTITPLTKILDVRGIGGKIERTIRVHWLPEEVTWLDPALENVGKRRWLWRTVDDCPLYVEYSAAKHCDALRRDIRQVDGGGGAHVFEPRRCDSLNELEPGCYYVEEL